MHSDLNQLFPIQSSQLADWPVDVAEARPYQSSRSNAMRPAQLLLLAFVLAVLTKLMYSYNQRCMPALNFLFWAMGWIGTAAIILFADAMSFLAHLLGIGRGADSIIHANLLLSFYLILWLYLPLARLEQVITLLIREIALEQLPISADSRADNGDEPVPRATTGGFVVIGRQTIKNGLCSPLIVFPSSEPARAFNLTPIDEEQVAIALGRCRGLLLDIGCRTKELARGYWLRQGIAIVVDIFYSWPCVDVVSDTTGLPFPEAFPYHDHARLFQPRPAVEEEPRRGLQVWESGSAVRFPAARKYKCAARGAHTLMAFQAY
jgi:hypothetical protein